MVMLNAETIAYNQTFRALRDRVLVLAPDGLHAAADDRRGG